MGVPRGRPWTYRIGVIGIGWLAAVGWAAARPAWIDQGGDPALESTNLQGVGSCTATGDPASDRRRADDAARAEIARQIRGKIYEVGQRMASGDVLLIYLAMHGTLLRSDTEPDGNDEAFLPVDAQRGNPGTYLRDNDLVSILRDVNGRVVLVIDACFAGGTGAPTWRDPEHMDVEIPDFSGTDDLATAATAVLTASRGDEPARDGVLARHLISAFEPFEQADQSGDRQLSVQELWRYVQRDIQGQHPQLLPGYRDVALADRSIGYVDIDSTPPGATVYIGDDRVGQTPLQDKPIPVGEHILRLQKRCPTSSC